MTLDILHSSETLLQVEISRSCAIHVRLKGESLIYITNVNSLLQQYSILTYICLYNAMKTKYRNLFHSVLQSFVYTQTFSSHSLGLSFTLNFYHKKESTQSFIIKKVVQSDWFHRNGNYSPVLQHLQLYKYTDSL